MVPSNTSIWIEPINISRLEKATIYASSLVIGRELIAEGKKPIIILFPVLPSYCSGILH